MGKSVRETRYLGPLGKTRTERVLYMCPTGAEVSVEVVRCIDASTDMDLAEDLLERAGLELNYAQCSDAGDRYPIEVSVVFHDPSEPLFALVLPDSQRHRELEARSDLFAELADDSNFPVPHYVRHLEVVFGSAGLRELIAGRRERDAAKRALEDIEVREAEVERRERDLDGRFDELRALEEELERRGRDLDSLAAELSRRERAAEEALAASRALADRRVAADAEDSGTDLAVVAEGDLAVGDSVAALELPPLVALEPHAPVARRMPTEVATSPFERVEDDELESHARRDVRPTEEMEAVSAPEREIVLEALAPGELEALEPSNAFEPHRPYGGNDAIGVDAGEPEPEEHGEVGGDLDAEEIEPEEIVDDEVVVADQLVTDEPPAKASGADDAATRIGGQADAAIERWITSREPSLATVDEAGSVRLAIAGAEATIEGLLASELKVMLQLHRMKTYPVITLSIGTKSGFATGSPAPATFFFDIEDSSDAAVLAVLSEDFTFQIDLFDTDYLPVRKRTIASGLAANVQYLMTAALDYLGRLGERPSLSRALIAYDDPSYDRFGRVHPERPEFREDVIRDLSRASRVRWAVHVCRRFSTPEGEEYLFLTRGYPIGLWHKRRQAVIERATGLGLWMGNTLARVAVSEGGAESHEDLAVRLAKNFVKLVAARGEHDLDDEAVRDNWTALAKELRGLGIDPEAIRSPSTEPIHSEYADEASGTIGDVTALLPIDPGDTAVGLGFEQSIARSAANLSTRSVEDVVRMLADRDRRYEAALELCRRNTPSSVRPVFDALERMTRAEAGHVLGGTVAYGSLASPHLVGLLSSRKGFLRQGAALALAALGSEDGLEPVCELLMAEPTDIWREVARAIGDYGPRAVMPLVARLKGQPEVVQERLAWALAHIASRGDRIAIDTLAGGRDAVAAGVARHAIELTDLARSDNRSIWNPRPGREHTVKRAFSRRVLEGLPPARAARNELSSPALVLSEADLIEAAELEDDVEPLDESDLLPT